MLTDFGKVEYEAAWLEQKLEEYLVSENPLLLLASKIDMRDWPDQLYLCKYLISKDFPFNAIIYSKELASRYCGEGFGGKTDANPTSTRNYQELARSLKRALGNPEYLQEETVKFVLNDGIVVLQHEHHNRQKCDDNAFSVSWGGGDLTTCPPIVKNPEKMYEPDAIVWGREDCIYALNAIIKEGKLF